MEIPAVSSRTSGPLPTPGLPPPGQPGAPDQEPLQVRRRQINKQDEVFEALMALIDGALGMPHDPQANKLNVEETVAGANHVIQQRVVS